MSLYDQRPRKIRRTLDNFQAVSQQPALEVILQNYAKKDFVAQCKSQNKEKCRRTLDYFEQKAVEERTRANDLSMAIPDNLRQYWSQRKVSGYYDADNLIRQIRTRNGDFPVNQLYMSVRLTVGDYFQLKARLDNFEMAYANIREQLSSQSQRFDQIREVLLNPKGAAKLAEWQGLATTIENMNVNNFMNDLASFSQNLNTNIFNENDVETARLLPNGNGQKAAVICFLKDLFASGLLKLDTWASFYPTDWDLMTGEFGGEWHLRCGQSWINSKWVFHAHCESIKDDSGYIGFRFKSILGTNHLKMKTERLGRGVQLDLPLSQDTLDQMAVPYQQIFLTRARDDANFKSVLKKQRHG